MLVLISSMKPGNIFPPKRNGSKYVCVEFFSYVGENIYWAQSPKVEGVDLVERIGNACVNDFVEALK